MKTNTTFKILLGIGFLAFAGLYVYRIRSRNTGDMLTRVAEEGYETAHDVLYPLESQRGNLRYGPVLPS